MINKWKYLLMASMVCALALAAGSLAIADDDEWLAFEGTIDGQFVDGPDPRPRIFTARTTAVGDSTLGPLSLATFVFQDASEVPPDCLPGSSIGAGGRASIVLADSSMQLEPLFARSLSDIILLRISQHHSNRDFSGRQWHWPLRGGDRRRHFVLCRRRNRRHNKRRPLRRHRVRRR